jgi:hypothetical protein
MGETVAIIKAISMRPRIYGRAVMDLLLAESSNRGTEEGRWNVRRARRVSLTAAAMMKYSSTATLLFDRQREATRVVTIKVETTKRATTTPVYIRLFFLWRAVTGRPSRLAEIPACSAISLADHSVDEIEKSRTDSLTSASGEG